MDLPRSDDEILLLHNPRCSKSRATKALLEESGRSFSERLYLEEPLSAAELAEVGARLDLEPAQWIRSKEAAYAEAGLGSESDASAHFAAMEAHPILMERPIVLRGERAVMGRPPENVHSLLG